MPSYDPDDAAGKLAKKVPLKYANDGTRLFTTSSRVKDAINTARVAEGKEPSRILSMDVDSMADAAKFGD